MKQKFPKGQAVIWVVVGLAVLLGIYLFQRNRSVEPVPTDSKYMQPGEASPTISATPASDTQIDEALKNLDSESKELDKMPTDTPINIE